MRLGAYSAALAALAGACFSGDATLGSICRQDSDCGAEQTCDNEVCGQCGDGFAQPGEVCFREGESIVLGPTATAIRPAEIDRDGTLDLVALAPGGAALQVLRGAGRSFLAPELVGLPTTGQVFAIGDLDGDGTSDALVSDGAAIRLGLGSGALAFSFGDQAVMWAGATAIELAPATATEAAFAVASRAATEGTELVALAVEAGGILRLGAGVTLPGDATPVASAELLGDGRHQVAAVAGNELVIVSGAGLEVSATLVFERSLTAVALVDVDGDGVRDVVTVDDDNAVSIDHGDGQGGFVRRDAFRLPGTAAALIVGDLDRDRDRDLAFASPDRGVLLQLARGPAYPETTALGGPESAADLLVADLDGDTLPELIVSSGSTGQVTTLELDP